MCEGKKNLKSKDQFLILSVRVVVGGWEHVAPQISFGFSSFLFFFTIFSFSSLVQPSKKLFFRKHFLCLPCVHLLPFLFFYLSLLQGPLVLPEVCRPWALRVRGRSSTCLRPCVHPRRCPCEVRPCAVVGARSVKVAVGTAVALGRKLLSV